MGTGRASRRFFFILLIAAAILFAYIVRPIASALFLAATLAGVLWPVQRRLSRRLRGRRGLSAGILVVGLIVIIIGPTVALSSVVISEGRRGVAFISRIVRSESIGDVLSRLPPAVGKPAKRMLDRLPVEDEQLTEQLREKVVAQGGNAAAAVGATLSATGSILFHTAMMLIAFYFLLLQGDQLVGWIDDLSPLRQGQTRELLAEFKRVSYAVILSTILTACVQAIAALVGYLIAQVPNPLFFTAITFVVAFIPAIGAGSVCLLVALLVLLTGHPYAAAFLAIWGLTVVALVDNLIKPLLIKAGMQMNGAVVFFSLIGGLAAFGAVGLLVGPLIVALLLSLLRMYQRDRATIDADATPS